MAMKRAEMEFHASEYRMLAAKASKAHADREYLETLTYAKASWKHIDGMMRYERKYENREFASVETIDLAVALCPVVFDVSALDELEVLLKGQRQIERNTAHQLSEKITESRSIVNLAWQLWSDIERDGRVQLACKPPKRKQLAPLRAWILEAWEALGVIQRMEDDGEVYLRFSTNTEDVALAKCPACGARAKAAKYKFLEMQSCPKCKNAVSFVLLKSN
ncbi:MAG: hypothetical protein WDZ59_06095 [Pirellulales bacterium]